ncbi:HET-domain-containing protein [Clathrospora elynae]|uniref:HET-domain-containing protein n=1 Tax=Clathrospora elynae TaxID=706981 RepID=A0A6A5T2T5_9PLEO|nr:HET-domain-containing protein [Clathrospora elynae]
MAEPSRALDSLPEHGTPDRGRYRRMIAACEHCQRRKTRCILAPDDPQGRCVSCIRLKKECKFNVRAAAATNHPRKPVACNNCRKKMDRCSSATGHVQGRCDVCIRSKEECSFEADAAVAEHRGRELDACDRCRQWKTQCRLASSDSEGRCTKCIELNEECSLERRGRAQNETRPSSPGLYHDSDGSHLQSPSDSFYHDDSPFVANTPKDVGANSPTTDSFSLFESNPIVSPTPSVSESFPAQNQFRTALRHGVLGTLARYQYSSISTTEIRLLRIAPGPFESDLFCSLKITSLDKITSAVHEFQALSYAWGNASPDHIIILGDIPRSGETTSTEDSTEQRACLLRKNLYQALKRIRQTNCYSWIWVDALCIDQANESEKSQQISKMPDIYSNAWNVIAWLGEGDGVDSADSAVGIIPVILNLKILDHVLKDGVLSEELFRSWVSFGQILDLSWFKRRWVIQEVSCARRLSVRIGHNILSWVDFADAVDLYSDNIDDVRQLYAQSDLYQAELRALADIDSSRAVALMYFSRSIFLKKCNSRSWSKLFSLRTLVLTASSFAVSDIRDIVYALLYLANDRDGSPSSLRTRHISVSDYSRHPVDIFIDFVRYCIDSSKSLDVICRPWASWPPLNRGAHYEGRSLPSWVGVASYGRDGSRQQFVPQENLLGPVHSPLYNASQGADLPICGFPPTVQHVLQADGIILGTVGKVSARMNGETIKSDCLRMLGWSGALEDGVDDRLWRTLVANRSPDGKIAPTWYRWSCTLALTQLSDSGHLNVTSLVTEKPQPSALVNYLKRVLVATKHRNIFHCETKHLAANLAKTLEPAEEAIVGLGPEDTREDHIICILFGCSVPVVLESPFFRRDAMAQNVSLVGACYVHGYMEGEVFAGMSKEEIQQKTTRFSIY